jgi:integrase-like protein
MTTGVAAPRAAAAVRLAGYQAARRRFPPRPAATAWPATTHGREQVLGQLAVAPASKVAGQQAVAGFEPLLDWLEDQEGGSWQERWLASGAEALAAAWLQLPAQWLHRRAGHPDRRVNQLPRALAAVIGGDIVRPSLAWLVAARYDTELARAMAAYRDPAGFARLAELCDRGSGGPVPKTACTHTLRRAAVIVAAKGGIVTDIEIGDVLELLDTEAEMLGAVKADAAACYRVLRQMGIFGPAAPMRLRELRTAGQRTPEQMIDRHNLACRPIRDLLVDYLKERQPGLDYASLEQLAHRLGMFWADLEAHHPGIDSLHLSTEAASAWKQRMQTKPKAITLPDGSKTVIETERICHREFLTPVRAFYLDLAQWAVEDPGRWARWAAPCPIGPADTIQGKVQRHRKSRMDARTRERLPVLPVLVRCAAQQHAGAAALLHAARDARPGDILTGAGQTLARAATRSISATVWAEDLATGQRRNITIEEDRAFWAWAAIEVLRATGIRIEELTELSHHSLVQYRLPATGELIPLLQIAPSKTDAERLLVISPELADVLSTIISRIRGPGGAVPLVAVYDDHERLWLAPAPVLFQRRIGGENRAIPAATIRRLLAAALARTGLTGPSGEPLHYTPHDFRRMFLTDAILNGLPPHIAQVIAGHRDINVTLGYKAAYPDEAIQAHLAFLARRRALRPTEEYRTPTDAEWAEFLGHFERRKVATGLCGRAFGTPCLHEHSCLRCALHWPDPAQRTRIAEIRDNLLARIAEAEREGWLGETEGLKISLAGAEDKLAQIDRRSHTVDLGMPTGLRQL